MANSPPFGFPILDGIHLRVHTSHRTLPRLLLPYITDRGKTYGYSVSGAETTEGQRNKVVVEFSSPNMASEFTVSHLRSTLIGAFVANLYQGFGWDVVRTNYLGNWGKQIGLLAAGWSRFGSEELFVQQPVRHLLDVKRKIEELSKPEKEAIKAAQLEHKDTTEIENQGLLGEGKEFFKRMEDKDVEAVALWQKFRDEEVAHYVKAYARLGIAFDEYSGESAVTSGSIAQIEDELREKGLSEEKSGSWIIDFAKHNAKGLGVGKLRTSGTTGYLLRDLAAVLDRDKAHHFDKMIYVVEMKQDTHMGQILAALNLMGRKDLASKIQHVSFAPIRGLEGPLKGAQVLDDYIDGCSKLMEDAMSARAEKADGDAETLYIPDTDERNLNLGISALIVQDMGYKRAVGYAYDGEAMATLERDSGPAFQNCHARLVSVLREGASVEGEVVCSELEGNDEYVELLRIMAQWPDTALTAFRALEPNVVVGYLGRLAEQIMAALDGDDEETWEGREAAVRARMELYTAAKVVLGIAMRVLGLKPA